MKRFWRKGSRLIWLVALVFILPLEIEAASHCLAKQLAQETDHSLGYPSQGLLIWENDEEFLKLSEENKTPVRMAAFQTTLPDPLPGEEYNVGLAAKMLAGTVVQPGQIFSMNGTLGPRTREKGFREGPAYSGGQVIRVIGGGICKISTTLYNMATLANLQIIERRPHGMLVPYVPPGQDATVSYGTTDFKFRNTTDSPLMIWAEKVDNTLYMAFYGKARVPRVTWHHQVLLRRAMPVIRRYNPRLLAGKEQLVQAGAEGVRVKNWILIHHQDGTTERKDLGIDYYVPMPQIIDFRK